MRSVLGIDAAWTGTQPSGVALVEETTQGWRLKAVASSYSQFLAIAEGTAVDLAARDHTSDAVRLTAACVSLVGEPDLVAVDMPLSRQKIIGRRASDLSVSRAFGARKCATHSPSAIRPGPVSDRLRAAFESAGYHLWTCVSGPSPGLIEVYPHPGLLVLMNAPTRLCCKAGKTLTYWPGQSRAARRANLFAVWAQIVAALDREIEGVAAMLGAPAEAAVGRALKAYEDKLDAIVCAWIGIRVLQGRAEPHGDTDSAIWIPLAPSAMLASAAGAA